MKCKYCRGNLDAYNTHIDGDNPKDYFICPHCNNRISLVLKALVETFAILIFMALIVVIVGFAVRVLFMFPWVTLLIIVLSLLGLAAGSYLDYKEGF